MKHTSLLSTLTLALSLPAFAANNLHCRVISVVESENIWEEGLGKYGDASVDDDSETVVLPVKGKVSSIHVGQKWWSQGKDGAVLSRKIHNGETTFNVTVDGQPEAQLKLYDSELGLLLLKKDSKWVKVATFDCSSVEDLLNVSITDERAHLMSKTALSKMNKEVLNNIQEVEFSVELGDGYYSPTEIRLYEVISEEGVLMGYIAWEHLNFTEGDPVTAWLYFDRNGLRLGEIETALAE